MKTILTLLASLILCASALKAQTINTNEPATTLAFAWQTVSNASSYTLYAGTNSGIYFTNWTTTNNGYCVSNLVHHVTYYFAVSACDNADNCSAYSTEISYVFYPPSVPSNFMFHVVIP